MGRLHAHMQRGTSTNPDWIGSERHKRALSEAIQERRRAGCSAAGDVPERSPASPSSRPLKSSLWHTNHLRWQIILRIDEWGSGGLGRGPHIFFVLSPRSRRGSGVLVVSLVSLVSLSLPLSLSLSLIPFIIKYVPLFLHYRCALTFSQLYKVL